MIHHFVASITLLSPRLDLLMYGMLCRLFLPPDIRIPKQEFVLLSNQLRECGNRLHAFTNVQYFVYCKLYYIVV